MRDLLAALRAPRFSFAVLLLILLATLAVTPPVRMLCDAARRGAHVLTDNEGLVAQGYVLLPVARVAPGNSDSGEVRLVDSSGITVHAWKTEFQPLVAYLQDNGDILVGMISPNVPAGRYPDGTTGILARLDWDGNVLWKYEDERMNHDFDLMPDGSIAYMRWDKIPPEKAYRISGGAFRKPGQTVWANEIVVLNPDREITWTWRAHEHMDSFPRVIAETVPGMDWIHSNSIRYVKENPVTGTPAFLVSMRNISTVALIDARSGEVIWHSPEGAFSLQHDATLLQNGNILVFDNGTNDPDHTYLTQSRVVEMDVPTGEEVWVYTGGESNFEKLLFSSQITSGAERLPNGNTLMTVSTQGRIYEVTPDKKIAWEYVSDHRDAEGKLHGVFKARKYNPEGTGWGWRIPITTPLTGALCS